MLYLRKYYGLYVGRVCPMVYQTLKKPNQPTKQKKSKQKTPQNNNNNNNNKQNHKKTVHLLKKEWICLDEQSVLSGSGQWPRLIDQLQGPDNKSARLISGFLSVKDRLAGKSTSYTDAFCWWERKSLGHQDEWEFSINIAPIRSLDPARCLLLWLQPSSLGRYNLS